MPGPCVPSADWPSQVQTGQDIPRLDAPCLTLPCRAIPSHERGWAGVEPARGPSTLPCHDRTRHALPLHAFARPGRDVPGLAIPGPSPPRDGGTPAGATGRPHVQPCLASNVGAGESNPGETPSTRSAWPSSAWPSDVEPSRTLPRIALFAAPCLAAPVPASPRQASPGVAEPSQDPRCHTPPRTVGPSQDQVPTR
jgi:hypothetical protein